MIPVRTALIASYTALVLSGTAIAQPGSASGSAAAPPTAAAELSDGEIRKVDKEGKKLTLKHGPLKNLDMPGMTMVFQVKDEALLDQVQTGDRVRFQAEKIDGKFTVTRIEAAR